MSDRDFTEVDLRRMLADATGFRADVEPGRWVIESSHDNRSWDIIVEPDSNLEILVVITAYPIQ